MTRPRRRRDQRPCVRKRDDEPQPRQREDVEADVHAELRVGLAERLRRCATAGRSATALRRRGRRSRPRTSGIRDHDQPAQRLDGLAVPVEARPARRGRGVDRAGAVADVEAGADDAGHDEPADDAEQDLGAQLGEEDAAEVDRVEPEHLGPELRDQRRGDADDDEDQQRRDQGAAPAIPCRGSLSSPGSIALASGLRVLTEPVAFTHQSSPICLQSSSMPTRSTLTGVRPAYVSPNERPAPRFPFHRLWLPNRCRVHR